jgi:hypothetical protein
MSKFEEEYGENPKNDQRNYETGNFPQEEQMYDPDYSGEEYQKTRFKGLKTRGPPSTARKYFTLKVPESPLL